MFWELAPRFLHIRLFIRDSLRGPFSLSLFLHFRSFSLLCSLVPSSLSSSSPSTPTLSLWRGSFLLISVVASNRPRLRKGVSSPLVTADVRCAVHLVLRFHQRVSRAPTRRGLFLAYFWRWLCGIVQFIFLLHSCLGVTYSVSKTSA
jgi:hypothetical protein